MKGDNLDNRALQMSQDDNVATALAELNPSMVITTETTTISIDSKIPFGHKFALKPISSGDDIYKYGEIIGRATKPIQPGDWVHTHNCESTRGRGDMKPTANSQGDT